MTSLLGHNSPLERLRRRQRAIVTRRAADRADGPALTQDEESLLREILVETMDYIDSDEFRKPDAERTIYERAPSVQRPDVSWYRPLLDSLVPGDRSKTRSSRGPGSVLLTGAQERVLFLQYNYARHRIAMIQERLAGSLPDASTAREILRWYRVAKRYREQIAETNLALVLAMAKRTRMSEVDFADLISEGNMALMRSVDKFDCGRGFKFSTYACRAIIKAFSRQGMKLSKYRQRFPSEFDPQFEKSNHLETVRATDQKDSAAEVRHVVMSNACDLTDIERTVILHRFGLDPQQNRPALTLDQVGQIIGVTKERVRQIQNKALEKIRTALDDLRADPPRPSEN